MHVQYTSDMRKWFADIRSHYSTDFDVYYLCLMAGIASGRKERFEHGIDLIEHFPKEFKAGGRLLVGLLLAAVLKARGIELTEREAVSRNVRGMVEATPFSLSADGVRLMNQYAYGGWLALCECFSDDRPRSPET